ncbi:unnamed protein product [Spirodela intermedia]|uniref:Uncharacterized protein n=1 Tax=Spirodela intermedia TaxID=51605 RepID=A0A7I8IP80_SPIIN|nr:unnamed protein product [Spirodela intermedia]CAA6659758.1 unnamed protein product [Spirodela intermedia]
MARVEGGGHYGRESASVCSPQHGDGERLILLNCRWRTARGPENAPTAIDLPRSPSPRRVHLSLFAAPKFPSPSSSSSCFFGLRLRTGHGPPGRRLDKPAVAVTCVSSRPARKGPGRRSDGGLSEAQELVRSLLRKTSEGKQPLVPTLNRFVSVLRTEHCFLMFEELGKKDRWLQCLEVFRWMQKQRWYVADNGIYSKLISMRNSGCRPDTSVYNALIAAHLRQRDRAKALAKAWGYFEKMKAMERCQPNVVTYNILLRAYAQAGDTQRVEALFRELDEGGGAVAADGYTFNGVMDAYGKSGMLREMEAVLRRMKSSRCRPDAITFNLLIDAYGKNQAFDKMEQVFRSLLRSKERPTLPTFNSMILNYGRARQREKAEEIFTKMGELGYKPSAVTYESLIAAYGFCDSVARARQLIEVSTLNAMLDAYCTNGLPGEADQLLDHAARRGLLPNASTYKLLYRAFARASRKDLILKLLRIMDQAGIVPNKNFFLEALGDFSSSPPLLRLCLPILEEQGWWHLLLRIAAMRALLESVRIEEADPPQIT